MLIEKLNIIIIIISGISFIFYGLSLFFSKKMRNEFIRFKLKEYTFLVGTLELIGGMGLLFGIYNSNLLISSSFGLALLMLLGVFTRIKIKDKIAQTLPAILFLFINSYIFINSLKTIL